MPDARDRGVDRVEQAIVTVARRGGSVEIGIGPDQAPAIRGRSEQARRVVRRAWDAVTLAPTRESDVVPRPVHTVRITYVGRTADRARLRGAVRGSERHAFDLAGLGWERSSDEPDGSPPGPADEPEAARRARVEWVEAHRRARTPDAWDAYRRAWEAPPTTPARIAADVRATLRIVNDGPVDPVLDNARSFDDRAQATVRHDIRRTGLLDEQVGCAGGLFGALALLAGCLIAGFFILMPRDADSSLVIRAGIAGILAWFAIGLVAPWVIERLPGARDWGCFVYVVVMMLVPAVAVIGWALYGF